MTCLFRSIDPKASALVPCCGGKVKTIDLFECSCNAVESLYCLPITYRKDPLDVNGQTEIIACCRICSHNTDPPKRTKKAGPGSKLKDLFEWWGAEPCEYCEETATMMDEWGPDGCLDHMKEILDRIGVAAADRGIPYSRWTAEKFVRIAVKRARK
jgi:hypothetical protein